MGNLRSAVEESENRNIEGVTTTWNGALSYGAINDPLVELFFKSVRDIPCVDYRCITVKKSKNEGRMHRNNSEGKKRLEEYFDAAWESDPLRTLKFLFYLRDCRGGKGERKLFRALVRHMRERGLGEHLEVNLKHIPFFGSWKDISVCFFGTSFEKEAIELIANQLKEDLNSEMPSLCAKYAPGEGSAIDKAHNAGIKISNKLGVNLTQYRKRYLTPLRKKLNIVEQEMCSKQWDQVNYEKVPSIAGSKYKKAFNRHDKERYSEYLSSVKKGEKKMNTSVLMPHQIVGRYINCGRIDETIEAQWVSFIANRKEKWPKNVNVLPIVDVSGSMFCGGDPQPGEVAVALGLTFATLNTSERYMGKIITFSSNPEMLSVPIKEDSLYKQVNYIKRANWEMTTDFQKAFDLILNTATMYNIPQEDMPQILLVLSDMQFDQAQEGVTNWEEIENKYKRVGYKRPIIIFWNLNGNSNDYPVPSAKVPNCALLSGYNDSILYKLLDGEMPNPIDIVHKALDAERYNIIHLA